MSDGVFSRSTLPARLKAPLAQCKHQGSMAALPYWLSAFKLAVAPGF
jgi:hypothetical protein